MAESYQFANVVAEPDLRLDLPKNLTPIKTLTEKMDALTYLAVEQQTALFYFIYYIPFICFSMINLLELRSMFTKSRCMIVHHF